MTVICFYLSANTMGYTVNRTHEGYSHVAYIHSSTDMYYSLIDTVLWARQEAVWILAEASDFSAVQNIQGELWRPVSHLPKAYQRFFPSGKVRRVWG